MDFLKNRSSSVLGTAVLLAVLGGATRAVVAQSLPPYTPPKTATGQPDLNGFWQALNTANWDIEEHGTQAAPYQNLLGAYLVQPPGFSVVDGGPIPYTPAALAMKKQRFENRLKHNPMHYGGPRGDEEDLSDPEAKCFLAGGLVRGHYMPYPWQIIQGKNTIVMAYQFASGFRIIHMTESPDLDKVIDDKTLENDSWLGRSAGRWEGNTLVVKTKGPYYRSVTLDRAGNFMSPNAQIVERYTPISPYHLRYEATIEDPDTFTRPWTLRMPIHRIVEQPRMELLELQCLPYVEEFMYGSLRGEKRTYPAGVELR
jgi:hypothetical protein